MSFRGLFISMTRLPSASWVPISEFVFLSVPACVRAFLCPRLPSLLVFLAFLVLSFLVLAPLLIAGRRGRAFVLFLARFLAVTPVFAAQLGASDPNWARSTFRAATIVQGVQLTVAHSIVLFSNAVVLVGLAE